MPSILTDADKETVKRHVPKPANKILAVAVARLYVAYPDPQQWKYTGVQGAAVICNDLVGRTFWLKIVDVSVSACKQRESEVTSADNVAVLTAPGQGRDLGPGTFRQLPL
jgi:hypothetical protein